MKRCVFIRLLALVIALVLLLPASALAASKKKNFQASNGRDARLKALELLKTCAFSSEYNDNGRDQMTRWEKPIYVYAGGSPTKKDLSELDSFLMQLNVQVPLLPNITRVAQESQANITVYYVKLSRMSEYVSDYHSGNWGYFSYRFQNNVRYQARIALAIDKANQKQRNHLMREELVGALGLSNDHEVYADSILYQAWTEVQTLSDVDWLMLNMVYSPYTAPGMTYSQVYAALYPRLAE